MLSCSQQLSGKSVIQSFKQIFSLFSSVAILSSTSIATNLSSAYAASNSNIAPQQKLALKQTTDKAGILSETRNRLQTKLTEFTTDQPAKIDWKAPRNDTDALSLQLLSKYNTAEKLSN